MSGEGRSGYPTVGDYRAPGAAGARARATSLRRIGVWLPRVVVPLLVLVTVVMLVVEPRQKSATLVAAGVTLCAFLVIWGVVVWASRLAGQRAARAAATDTGAGSGAGVQQIDLRDAAQVRPEARHRQQ